MWSQARPSRRRSHHGGCHASADSSASTDPTGHHVPRGRPTRRALWTIPTALRRRSPAIEWSRPECRGAGQFVDGSCRPATPIVQYRRYRRYRPRGRWGRSVCRQPAPLGGPDPPRSGGPASGGVLGCDCSACGQPAPLGGPDRPRSGGPASGGVLGCDRSVCGRFASLGGADRPVSGGPASGGVLGCDCSVCGRFASLGGPDRPRSGGPVSSGAGRRLFGLWTVRAAWRRGSSNIGGWGPGSRGAGWFGDGSCRLSARIVRYRVSRERWAQACGPLVEVDRPETAAGIRVRRVDPEAGPPEGRAP
jgi:hypothetical protein